MKGLAFVGGYKPDKSVFSVVTDDDAGVRTCHIFKWNAPVWRWLAVAACSWRGRRCP